MTQTFICEPNQTPFIISLSFCFENSGIEGRASVLHHSGIEGRASVIHLSSLFLLEYEFRVPVGPETVCVQQEYKVVFILVCTLSLQNPTRTLATLSSTTPVHVTI